MRLRFAEKPAMLNEPEVGGPERIHCSLSAGTLFEPGLRSALRGVPTTFAGPSFRMSPHSSEVADRVSSTRRQTKEDVARPTCQIQSHSRDFKKTCDSKARR